MFIRFNYDTYIGDKRVNGGEVYDLDKVVAQKFINDGAATLVNGDASAPSLFVDASGNVSIAGGSGQIYGIQNTYTWAQLQALTGVTAGTRAYVSDIGNQEFIYRSGYWQPTSVAILQPSGGIPFVFPASGATFGATGAFTGMTSMNAQVYSACYMYLPSTVTATAGWYYTVMSSATAGQCYTATLSGTFATATGAVAIPGSLNALTTTAGVMTQTASEIPVCTWNFPVNLMAPQSSFVIDYTVDCSNGASTKKASLYFAGGDQVQNNTIISAGGGNFQFKTANQGSQTVQVTQANNYGGYSAAAGNMGRGVSGANFANSTNVSLTVIATPATDWVVFDSYKMTLYPYL